MVERYYCVLFCSVHAPRTSLATLSRPDYATEGEALCGALAPRLLTALPENRSLHHGLLGVQSTPGRGFDRQGRICKTQYCCRLSATLSLVHVPKWRNWQTRMVQVHVLARVWGFESLLRHQNRNNLFAISSLAGDEFSG